MSAPSLLAPARASVLGSTPICPAASFRESPRVVRWRTNCSARVFAEGSGL